MATLEKLEKITMILKPAVKILGWVNVALMVVNVAYGNYLVAALNGLAAAFCLWS